MKSVISIGNQDFISIRKNNCFYKVVIFVMNMRRKMSVLSLFIRKMQACQSQEMLE